VFFGSTNPGQPYLADDTGNRRFWPVPVGRIDLAALQRDRDQLWAEASTLEASGISHALPECLWDAAAIEQNERTESDSWEKAIGDYIALKKVHETDIMECLTDNQFLQLKPGEVGQREQNRAARVLRGLGFTRYRARTEDGRRPWRYRR
jgi:predicted P-loop ATPase